MSISKGAFGRSAKGAFIESTKGARGWDSAACWKGVASDGDQSGCGGVPITCLATDDPTACTGPQVSDCQSTIADDFAIQRLCFRTDIGRYYIGQATKGLIDWYATYTGPAGGSKFGVYTLDIEYVGPAPATITISACPCP